MCAFMMSAQTLCRARSACLSVSLSVSPPAHTLHRRQPCRHHTHAQHTHTRTHTLIKKTPPHTQVLKDINVNVVSGEIDTLGDQAQDEFFVTYHGEPLGGPMTQLVTNALQYYLSLSEVAKEESY